VWVRVCTAKTPCVGAHVHPQTRARKHTHTHTHTHAHTQVIVAQMLAAEQDEGQQQGEGSDTSALGGGEGGRAGRGAGAGMELTVAELLLNMAQFGVDGSPDNSASAGKLGFYKNKKKLSTFCSPLGEGLSICLLQCET